MNRLASWVLLSLLAAPLAAEPRRYALDPIHTRIAFRVGHAGFSQAIGTFSGITGTLEFDPEDWPGARVDARIPIASLDLGDATWRERVLDPTFFAAQKHPEARFVSTRVEVVAANRLRVLGRLDLHGEQEEVALEVEVNRVGRHPLTLRHTAGFSARATLSRAAFGMRKWKNLVGDEVEVSIEIEALRDRGNDEEKD
jgi:polyisoprenoid-binding protein YceI